MASEAWKGHAWQTGLMAGFERLVHPSVRQDRARQQRLIGVLLAAPFFVCLPMAQALLPSLGMAALLAIICGLLIAPLSLVLLVVMTGLGRLAERVALACAAALVAGLAVAFGGLASPAVVLALALPVEAFWITRSARDAWRAAAAAGLALGLPALAFALAEPAMAPTSAWHWLGVGAYAATLALRFSVRMRDEGGRAQDLEPADWPQTTLLRMSFKGDVAFVSDGARALLGLEPEMLLGSGLFERIHVADRVDFLCTLASLDKACEPRRVDLRLRLPASGQGTAGGGHRWCSLEFAPAEPEDQTVRVLLRDGGETARLRQELAEAHAHAEKTQMARDRLLASVSHELRTPLNAIIGFSDMLLDAQLSDDLSHKQAERVGLIREAGSHLLSVVNAVLDVSKVQSGSYGFEPEPFNLKETVALTCAIVQPQAEAKRIAVTARVADNVGAIVGDRLAVQQILLNLLSNAVKFTPDGGKVRVSALRNAERVLIRVSDTGIGIAEPDLRRIGEPFMQVHNDYTRQCQGTGLGLSLVKGLVRMHGGMLGIDSAPGAGTAVTISLPVAGEATQSSDATKGNHAAPLLKIA